MDGTSVRFVPFPSHLASLPQRGAPTTCSTSIGKSPAPAARPSTIDGPPLQRSDRKRCANGKRAESHPVASRHPVDDVVAASIPSGTLLYSLPSRISSAVAAATFTLDKGLDILYPFRACNEPGFWLHVGLNMPERC